MGQSVCTRCGGSGFEAGVTSSGLPVNSNTYCYLCNGRGYVTTPDVGCTDQSVSEPGKPVLSWIDDLFEAIPTWFHWIGIFVSGSLGFAYGSAHDWHGIALIWPALLGMVAWPVGITLLRELVRGALVVLSISLAIAVIYAAWWIWDRVF